MGKHVKAHKQAKYRKLAKASEMKENPHGMQRKARAKRYSVAELSVRFSAAKIDMISGSCRDNLGHAVLDGERSAMQGLEFIGIIEPEAWNSGELDDIIPASEDTFAVSVPELKRGEFLFILANDSGDLRAIAYK